MEKELYIITVNDSSDLDDLYEYMESKSFKLDLKRPLSRNTHYWLTSEEAEELRKEPKIMGVSKYENIKFETFTINNSPYTINGDFWKDGTKSPNYNQWGLLHAAGSSTQRRKGSWGSDGTVLINDSVEIFNDGKHVDVVICDDPMAYNCSEWLSPTTNQSRFVQYQWYNLLNQYITGIDTTYPDSQISSYLSTGNIQYYTTSNNPFFHATHVAGIACGKTYGLAREANIYNLTTTNPFQSGQLTNGNLIFDYLRAFHRYKDINPVTGRRNPTITNHSYGQSTSSIPLSSVSRIGYNGTIYTPSSIGPGGETSNWWNINNIEKYFGIRCQTINNVPTILNIPLWTSALVVDVQDAIADGIVIIGAAGNANYRIASPAPSTNTSSSWNNFIEFTSNNQLQIVPYNRGSSPSNPDTGAIIVGALNNDKNFKRAPFSNYGPGITIFSPGVNILSCYVQNPTDTNAPTALNDTKYSTGTDYYQSLNGTSQATPQITGLAACLATNKSRFTNDDLLGYLNSTGVIGDMTFDTGASPNTGGFLDQTSQQGSPNIYAHIQNPRSTQGVLIESKGSRKNSGQTFPRRNSLFTP